VSISSVRELAKGTSPSPTDVLTRLGSELRAGRTRTAAELAMRAARGNAVRATDMLFLAKHPERRGRALQRTETSLIREWLSMRDGFVLPLLAVSGAPESMPTGEGASASQFTRSIPAGRRWALLVPILDRYRGEIPLMFLLGWLAVESDGRIDVVTSLDERGFFQIHPAESADARPPIQHRRLSIDPEYSVQAGVQLVRRYADLARRRFPWIPAGSELFWRVVKLQHAMGSPLAQQMLNRMHAQGTATTWDAIKRYELAEGPKLHRLLAIEPGRFGRNVDRVFERGAALARSLGR
jgi:hypothetical protein